MDGTIWNTMTLEELTSLSSGSSKCLVTLLAKEVVILVEQHLLIS